MFYLPGVLLIIPFGENLNRYQNPFRRPIMLSILIFKKDYFFISILNFNLKFTKIAIFPIEILN